MRHASAARRTAPGIGLAAVATALSIISLVVIPVLSWRFVPATRAAEPPTLTTPYPAVVVAPGGRVSFDVDVATEQPERVDLDLTGVPAGWTASIHGGGFVVDGVQTSGGDPVTVRVDVGVPPTATGTSTILLEARARTGVARLALQVRAEAAAGGDVTLTTDFPSLRGPASSTFSFNLTISNQTAEDLTFSVNAQGGAGWEVAAKLTGQAQAASAIVKAGSTAGVTVSATPPANVAAGTYPIDVVATAGARRIPATLQVEITGSYRLGLSTPTGRLNGSGTAGQETRIPLVLKNSGTAPLANVKLSATAPSGWKVTFEPETIATLDADATADVTATVVPSGDAIAGDYVVTMRAAGDPSASSSAEIRFTVETSLAWAAVGIGLIAAVGLGLWWVFRRYGRR